MLNPRHGDDTFRRGGCLRIVGGKEDFHAVFARAYYAAPIVLEAERAGNNDVRPLDHCFAAFEILIKVPLADIPLRGQRGRGGDDRFGELQKFSVGRMTGFAMAFSVLVALPPEQLPVSVWLLSVVQVRVCVPLPLEIHSPQL